MNLRRLEIEPLVEPAGAPRVLAGDEVGIGERLLEPRRDVADVPDRGRADDQPAGHQAAAPIADELAPRARIAAPIIPASGPSSAALIGVSFCGVRARARELLAGRAEQQVAGGHHAAADRRSRRGRRCSRGPRAPRRAAGRSSPGRRSRSDRRPGRARSRGARPRRRPRRQPAPAPTPGTRPTANSASMRSAVPEAIDSMQPWLGQFPWQGGPSMSTTTCPSSAAAPREPRNGLPPRIRPPPIPVPIVSRTTLLGPARRAPAELRDRGGVAVVVERDRQAGQRGDPLAAAARRSAAGDSS